MIIVCDEHHLADKNIDCRAARTHYNAVGALFVMVEMSSDNSNMQKCT